MDFRLCRVQAYRSSRPEDDLEPLCMRMVDGVRVYDRGSRPKAVEYVGPRGKSNHCSL